jgi:hypothetical protein
MAVISVTTLAVKPDKYEALLDVNRKTKEIFERFGAKNFRFIGTLVAGEASGSLAVTWEADDFASYGTIMDKFLADEEGLALLMESNSTAGPTAGWQSSVWSDIPL